MFTATVLVLALAAPAASPDWLEAYRKGVRLVEEGQGREARLALGKALELRPASALKVPVGGVDYVDYLPHLYLAAACHLAGDVVAAREALVRAEKDGLAAKSDAGKPLLDAYRVLLGAPPPVAASPLATSQTKPRYAEFERKKPLLSDAQDAELRAEVLARCQLRPDTKATDAPWYFHYQLGRSFLEKGDSQRALDAFLDAATRRNDPARGARMYGMWFTTYLPYFAIAQAHAKLGNWDCARSAIEMSEKTHEVSARDDEFREFRSLVLETEKNLGPTQR